MAIEKRETLVAKELDDALLLVKALIVDIKAGKSPSEIVSGNVPALIAAIAGLDQVSAELAANPEACYSTVGSRVGEIAAALLKK